jgi:hypothetical protein
MNNELCDICGNVHGMTIEDMCGFSIIGAYIKIAEKELNLSHQEDVYSWCFHHNEPYHAPKEEEREE